MEKIKCMYKVDMTYCTNVVKVFKMGNRKLMAMVSNRYNDKFVAFLTTKDSKPTREEIDLVCYKALFNKESARRKRLLKYIHNLVDRSYVLKAKLELLNKSTQKAYVEKEYNGLLKLISRKKDECHVHAYKYILEMIEKLEKELENKEVKDTSKDEPSIFSEGSKSE